MNQPDGITSWCLEHLGAHLQELLWSSGHLSWVGCLRLDDGREVVLKARPNNPRLPGCHRAHAYAWEEGFPCPQPLTAPIPLGSLVVSAEDHRPGGRAGARHDPWLRKQSASELHGLVALLDAGAELPPLRPPPAWVGWAAPYARPWPPPDEGPPLNGTAATQELRPLAEALNARLAAAALPLVAGHADWHQGNLRWQDGRLFSADDWDSLTTLPEAALAGCAAVSFLPSPDGAPDRPGAEVDDTDAFLESYASARGTAFTIEELEVAWAAGLWQRAFDAAKSLAQGRAAVAREQLRDAAERLRRAGC